MTTKSIMECEKKSIEKMKKHQLSNKFKKIGIAILILSLISIVVNKFSFNNIEFRLIAKYGMLVGLLIISISKEKIEDELITKLRMQSFTVAFIFGVFYALVLPFIDYLFDVILKTEKQGIEELGDFLILWVLLSTQVFYFEFLKRSYK